MEILIRRSEPNDAAAVRDIYAGIVAYSGTLQLPYPSIEIWQKRLTDVPAHAHSLVAEVNGEIVGNVGLEVCTSVRRRHVGTFGIGVKDECQGQGIGSALLEAVINLADNWLNLKRLELTVYTDNQAAVHLYKKYGFVIEGTSPAFAFRNGGYVDAYQMGRVVAER